MRRAISGRGLHAHTRSAGIDALVGHRADPNAQTVLERRGMDISGHRAVQVDREMLQWANLILVMEDSHRSELRHREPDSAGKVLLLGHWLRSQVPDPYRGGLDLFEHTLDLIERSVETWVERI